jgi:RimJ/RimL family protein N-acetyltransferase
MPRAPLRRPQLSLAIAHRLKRVWLTVDRKNIPSQKICEILGAKPLETVRIPPSHEMYRLGARYRRSYLVDLKKIS